VILSGGAGRAAAQAQANSINRAVEIEQTGKWKEALAAWRSVLASGEIAQAALGLERVFAQLGQEDSTRIVIDSLLKEKPTDRILRSIQLRTLKSLGRDQEESAAFDEWVAAAPKDMAPYKEYANQLLMDSRAARADSVLQRGIAALGAKGFTLEMAQLNVAKGNWGAGAALWRQAMLVEKYLDGAAVFSMGLAPYSMRDSVRVELSKAPMDVSAKKALGVLEQQWGNAREAWRILSMLTIADSAYDTWSDFASEAERLGAWIPARDAYVRLTTVKPELGFYLKAANAAVSGGEPATALPILVSARGKADAATIRTKILPLEVRALTNLGRAADAEALVAKEGQGVDPVTQRIFARQLAWGWVRAGEVEKARKSLAGASADDDEEVAGWIALFEGDFVKARAGLRRPTDATPDVVTAMAMLGRTKSDTGRVAGSAFLALARGDTAGAAERFERSIEELHEAAPLLLAFAARLWNQKKNDTRAISLWSRIVAQYALSPEAAESDLEWARALRRRGDRTGASERFEHLIISYPNSALVPQARRELEALRSGVAHDS
jgi:tetratricopeptide (TPR) repeat protein